MKRAERYASVLEWFGRNMPDAEAELHYRNAFELLVAVVLSAQCTDKRVNQVTPALFEAYPTPEAMAVATADDLLFYIRSVSYPNSKAAHLQGLASVLVREFGGAVPDSAEALQRLPGVGRKTANVVLAVWFGRAAMPVDTHVFRVAHRLGLVSPKAATPLAVERTLTAHIPAGLQAKAHHWLLLHGRYTCTARKPACAKCGLSPLCPASVRAGRSFSDKEQ